MTDRVRHLLSLILGSDYVHGFGMERAVEMAIDTFSDLDIQDVEDLKYREECLEREVNSLECQLDDEIYENEQLRDKVKDLEELVEELQAMVKERAKL